MLDLFNIDYHQGIYITRKYLLKQDNIWDIL